MIGGLRHVPWDDPAEAIPAFPTMMLTPLSVSITEGVAFGLVAYRAPRRRRDALAPFIPVSVLPRGSWPDMRFSGDA
jgi:xanthine/uracil/vitamin C permease (AzgA family)